MTNSCRQIHYTHLFIGITRFTYKQRMEHLILDQNQTFPRGHTMQKNQKQQIIAAPIQKHRRY